MLQGLLLFPRSITRSNTISVSFLKSVKFHFNYDSHSTAVKICDKNKGRKFDTFMPVYFDVIPIVFVCISYKNIKIYFFSNI